MQNYDYKYILILCIKASRELSISGYACVVPINKLAINVEQRIREFATE